MKSTGHSLQGFKLISAFIYPYLTYLDCHYLSVSICVSLSLMNKFKALICPYLLKIIHPFLLAE